MLLSLVLLIPPGPAIFGQSIEAFRARKSFSVAIGLDATMSGHSTSRRYQLAYAAPSKVLITGFENGKTKFVIWLNGSRLIAYDPLAGEMVVRKAPTKGPIVNRVANAAGGLEDALAAQLSPDAMAAFLSPFRSLAGWSTRTRGDRVVISRPGRLSGKATLSEFEFSGQSRLLTRALLVGPNSRLQWQFAYGPPPATLAFSPPPGTKTVNALSEHMTINTSDAKARAQVDRSLRAYGRLTSIAFTVSSPEGVSDNWMSGSWFRERQAKVDWCYSHGVLTIRDLAKGRSYRGRCRSNEILSYLKVLRTPMDPVLQSLLLHHNPISGWFVPGMAVSSRGTVKLGVVTGNAVELRSPRLEVSLLIRSDNSLVASVSSRTKYPTGEVLSEAHRDFTYGSVNKRLPASTFATPTAKYLPLSRVGRA